MAARAAVTGSAGNANGKALHYNRLARAAEGEYEPPLIPIANGAPSAATEAAISAGSGSNECPDAVLRRRRPDSACAGPGASPARRLRCPLAPIGFLTARS